MQKAVSAEPSSSHPLDCGSRWGRGRKKAAIYSLAPLLGLERPLSSFGHEPVAKSGVAPAQHGVSPASKLSILSRATSSSGTCSIAKVNARVTDRVICMFHAAVTLPRWRSRLKLFGIVEPSTIKEGLENGKPQKKILTSTNM
jgi:hypothetical protein